MQIVDTGVLTPSFMDFSLPSEFAKSALYYCPQFGQFICNSDYRIERNGIDQYLLIYINSGSLCIRTDGMTAEAHEGEIALFDCRKPHCYWCPDKVDFYWFHFNGASSKQYTEYLTERFGLVHEKQPMIFRRRRSGLFRSDFTISDVICVLKNTEWVLTLSWGSKRIDTDGCNGVQREHNKKLNNGLPILHKVPPKRDYGRYFCIMAEKGGTSHGA